jgi:hypothetical protein
MIHSLVHFKDHSGTVSCNSAKRQAELKQVMLESATAERVKELSEKLSTQAWAGDTIAAKLGLACWNDSIGSWFVQGWTPPRQQSIARRSFSPLGLERGIG